MNTAASDIGPPEDLITLIPHRAFPDLSLDISNANDF
jgi:hypothetical protein